MRKFSKLNEAKTSPWYKKGQILVCFSNDVDQSVAQYILKKVGMKLITEPGSKKALRHPEVDAYLVNVPVGTEDDAVKTLNNLKEDGIEWAERRNLKWELRIKFTEYCYKKLKDLGEGDSELSDSEWKKRHDMIIDLLKLVSEDKYEEIKSKYGFEDVFKNL